MWSMLTEFKKKKELDRVLTILEDKKNNSQILYPNIQNEEMSLMSSLPVGMEKFSKLNETIAANSSFRQRLIEILNTIGGRDGKALTANILRKLISDDVGEKFSLTGKCSKNGIIKSSFEKTEIYKLIVEICFRTFNSKENQIREAISDWLMQSKFRKNRREKRRTIKKRNVMPWE